MRYLLIGFLFTLPLHAESPSVDEFKAQLAKLDAKSTKKERIAALQWIATNAESEHATLAVVPLEKLIRSEEVEEVRRPALAARYKIARVRKEPCPLVVIETLRDEVEFVRYEASMWAGLSKGQYADGSVKLLIEAQTDKRPGVRSDCLYHLGAAGGKAPAALQAIENAKKDKVFEVRQAAYCAHFRFTNNLADYLSYLIRLREEPGPLLDQFLPETEEAKIQQSLRNMFVLGSTVSIVSWSEDRPEELAKALVKLLDHKSPIMRRGAAELIGISARRFEQTQSKFPSAFELLLPYVEAGEVGKFYSPPSDGTAPKKGNVSPPKKVIVPPAPLPSNTYAHFLSLKAPRFLAYLSTMDEDVTVRTSASVALTQLAKLPEPLTVVPREVRPKGR